MNQHRMSVSKELQISSQKQPYLIARSGREPLLDSEISFLSEEKIFYVDKNVIRLIRHGLCRVSVWKISELLTNKLRRTDSYIIH